MKIIFPKELQCNYKTYSFLLRLNTDIEKIKNEKIYFDFKSTKIMATNHLAMLMYIVEGVVARNNIIIANIGNEEHEGSVLIDKLYEYYTQEKTSFIEPNKLSYLQPNDKPQDWLENLKKMKLCEYDRIKIMVSELIANLKMHTLYQEGTMAGYIDKMKKMLYISIVNYDLTIKTTFRWKQEKNFSNDYDAVMWALKKTNTTRHSDESGGLGLYLLRKYLYELKAQCIIVSGNCFLILDENSFDVNNENRIEYKDYRELPCSYEGNIVTLLLPLEINAKDENVVDDTRINQISLGDIDGLFD